MRRTCFYHVWLPCWALWDYLGWRMSARDPLADRLAPVYVGITSDPRQRFSRHRWRDKDFMTGEPGQKWWWLAEELELVETLWLPTRHEADALETRVIEGLRPLFNERKKPYLGPGGL